LNSQ
jgi:hypothetical protein